MDFLNALTGSDVMRSFHMYWLMREYPWIPFVIVIIIGAVITLIIMLIRSKKAKKQGPPISNVVEPVQPYTPIKDATYGDVTTPINGNVFDKVPVTPPNPQPNPQPMAVRSLVCVEGALKGRVFDISNKVYIGRDSHKCKIVYPKGTKNVSGVHCSVTYMGSVVTVTDEQSTCGTFIDGKRIPAGRATVMHRGQTLSLGSSREAFVLKGR